MIASIYTCQKTVKYLLLSENTSNGIKLEKLFGIVTAAQRKSFVSFLKLPETRPLYNLPQIKEADRVIWVEGEKCADALIKMGHTATCTIGGAGMLSQRTKDKFDFSPLHGKELIIWPDNDEAGSETS